MYEQQLERFVNKSQFIRPRYPKILSYPPNTINTNEYIFSIKDVEVSGISRIELKLTLPEIKGIGKVSYLPNYQFLLIKKFDILIKNQEDDCFKLYETFDGEDLYSRFNLYKHIETYNNSFGGKNDDFCSLREGTYNDCIIFPSREIIIPISISNYYCLVFPSTEIQFRVTLAGLRDIIMYNTVFSNKSLKNSITEFNTTSKNIKLSFTNIMFDLEKNEQLKRIKTLLRNEKTTCFEHGSDIIVSGRFKNAKHVSFYNKVNIFNDDDTKFIIPFGPSLKKEKLINNWIKRILEDLIIVTDKDLTNNSIKEELGFHRDCIFEKIENNQITFFKDIPITCEIYINNVPEDHDIYYHRNILTFTRRYMKSHILNISELFYFIKGNYYADKKISYVMDEIKHGIDIYHISIPVNIWNDQTNTGNGDLRSTKSKEDDFYYKNRFIYGMDILSKDTGYESVSISVGREKLTQYYQATYENSLTNNVLEFNQYYTNKNNYPNRSEFFTSHFNDSHFVIADDNINFNSINAEIKWKQYKDYDPLSLYKRQPTIVVGQVYTVEYDPSKHYISIMEK